MALFRSRRGTDLPIQGNTPIEVGPGIYSPSLPQDHHISPTPESYLNAPFSQSSSRSIHLNNSEFPGPTDYCPASYNLLAARPRTAAIASFKSAVPRLALTNQEKEKQSIPAVGSYNMIIQWKGKGNSSFRDHHSNTANSGLQYTRTSSAPSIPSAHAQFGWHSTNNNSIDVTQDSSPAASRREAEPGPGAYEVKDNLVHSKLTRGSIEYKKSKTIREMNKKSSAGNTFPGPGHYRPLIDIQYSLGNVLPVTSQFAATGRKEEKSVVTPGPGTYCTTDGKSNHDCRPDDQHFLTTSKRTEWKLSDAPAPGTYNLPSTLKIHPSPLAQPFNHYSATSASPTPFLTSTARFHTREHNHLGPGSYLVETDVAYELNKNKYSRNQSFLITAPRFPSFSPPVSACSPSANSIESSHPSYYHTHPPLSEYNLKVRTKQPHFPKTTESIGQKGTFGLSGRFQPVKTKDQIQGKSMNEEEGKERDRAAGGARRRRAVGNQSFLTKQSRFIEPIPVCPLGPGQYELDRNEWIHEGRYRWTPDNSVGVFRSKSARDWIKTNDVPSPTCYNQADQSSLIKKTFNVTLV